MVLKHNMGLSSTMVEEVANDELCKKVEEFMAQGTCDLQVFVPVSKLENISSSDLGFIQVGRHLPNSLRLAKATVEIIDEKTCSKVDPVVVEVGEYRESRTGPEGPSPTSVTVGQNPPRGLQSAARLCVSPDTHTMTALLSHLITDMLFGNQF